MKRKERRPKFRVGQVVAVKHWEGGPPIEFVRLYRKKGESFQDDDAIYAHGGKDPWYHVTELRPLTKREAWR